MPTRLGRSVSQVLVLLLVAGASMSRADGAEKKARWIVAYPPAFETALEPLCDVRRAQGYDVVRVNLRSIRKGAFDHRRDARALRAHLAKLVAGARGTTYILLVGSVPVSGMNTPPAVALPALPGTVGRMRQRPSDNGYGCIDDDLLPDVAVGRFPASNVGEVEAMVNKTIAFERQRTAGPASMAWRRRIALLVGHPGGSNFLERGMGARLVNGDISSALQKAHPYWDKRAVIHMDISPFCPPTPSLRKVSMETLQAGQLLSIYLGHSGTKGLWSENAYSITRDDFATAQFHPTSGVFLTCGCWACHKGPARGEGYGLAAIRNPAGPVAVVGAYGESYGALGKLALEGLLPMLHTASPPGQLGAWWLAIQGGLDHGDISKLKFMLYDRADGSGGKVPLEEQRKEHLEMWMLLGDPALRLPLLPPTIALTARHKASPGETLVFTGVLPAALAKAQDDSADKKLKLDVFIERPFGTLPADFPKRLGGKGAARNKALMERVRAASRVLLAKTSATVANGKIAFTLQLPKSLPYRLLTIRVQALGARIAAHGVHVVIVQTPKPVGIGR